MPRSEETKLLIPKEDELASHQWVGMPIQQLLDYSNDPFWVRLRQCCFVFFWCAFSTLCVSVIALIVTAPRCQTIEWWQEGPMYGVFVHDFRNENTSDVNGLSGFSPQRAILREYDYYTSTARSTKSGTEYKLDYIVELGAKTIWLSPIYKSPMKVLVYDIEDYKEVDGSFGSLEDFKDLVQATRNRGLKLVMDLVPNHSSDHHIRFSKSVAKEDPFTNYYVWVPAKGYEDEKQIPPNNWLSVLGGSAWEWNEVRKEFYLHQFAKEQPDLNFRNPAVVEEMVGVMTFWLEVGLDGFRLDAMPYLFEDEALRDESTVNGNALQQGDYRGLEHVHTYNLPEVLDVMAKFRNTMDAYSEQTDKVHRLIMAEVFNSVENTMVYYGGDKHPLADFPFNFYLTTNIGRESSAHDIKNTIEQWMSNLPDSKWANWVLGNHYHGWVASQLGGDLVECLNMILLMLPGTAVTYSGEELGMEIAPVIWGVVGESATPEHSHKKNSDDTWSPLQTLHKPTYLDNYKALVRARHDTSIMYGALNMKVLSNCVFAFTRSKVKSKSYVVAVNWSNISVTVDLGEFRDIPEAVDIYVTSVNFSGGSSRTITTSSITLQARNGVVLTYIPETYFKLYTT